MGDEEDPGSLISIALKGRNDADRERTLDEIVALAEAKPELKDDVKELLVKEGGYTWEKLEYFAQRVNYGEKKDGKLKIKGRVQKWEGERLSLSEVRTQIRRTLIETGPISDDDIVKFLRNGTRMTGVEVEKVGGSARPDVTREFSDHPDIYRTKREGRTLVGYVTPANSEGVGFSYRISEPAREEAKPVNITIGGKQYTLDPKKRYAQHEVSTYLRLLEPNFFSHPETMAESMKYMKAEESGVLGSELLKLLQEIGAPIIVLSNNMQKGWRSRFRKSESQVNDLLKQPDVAAFIREMPLQSHKPYIMRTDEDKFYAAIESHISK